ncbi:general odorant-binding protein 99a-like [Condylostylus longicornis]|uniref:general odorant-binding protein 99a-like n=1 Tax=Condylostylus longicornis TaxID=2530218 RepID=UPI00244E370D|nr:general odorant-binding protein 99a-like [Condylostylus longicornis]
MKTIFAIFALILAVNAEWKINTQEDLMKYREECVAEKNVPTEHVDKYKKWDYPDDETTRCYLECVFNKMGLYDPKDGYNIDHLTQQLKHNSKDEHDDIRSRIENCIDKNEQKSDSCAYLFRGFKCFMSKNLQLVQQSIKQ